MNTDDDGFFLAIVVVFILKRLKLHHFLLYVSGVLPAELGEDRAQLDFILRLIILALGGLASGQFRIQISLKLCLFVIVFVLVLFVDLTLDDLAFTTY